MLLKACGIAVALVVLAICVALPSALPRYTSVHAGILAVICLASFVAGGTCLVALFKHSRAARGDLWTRQAGRWVLSVVATLALICWVPLALALCLTTAYPRGGFFGWDEFVGTASSGGGTFYLYHVTCFPPDNACECDDYRSLIYRESHYLPLMHWVAAPGFYVDRDGVEVRDGVLTLTAEQGCPQDRSKTLRIRL